MVDSVSTFLMKYTMHRWYFAFDSIELAVKTTLVRCSPISGRMPLELRLMMPLMNRFPLFLFPSYHPLCRLTCDIPPEAISMVTSMFIFHRAVSEVLTPRTVLHMLN